MKKEIENQKLYSTRDISEEYNTSRQRVSQIVDKLGIKKDDILIASNGRTRLFNEEQYKAITDEFVYLDKDTAKDEPSKPKQNKTKATAKTDAKDNADVQMLIDKLEEANRKTFEAQQQTIEQQQSTIDQLTRQNDQYAATIKEVNKLLENEQVIRREQIAYGSQNVETQTQTVRDIHDYEQQEQQQQEQKQYNWFQRVVKSMFDV